jgi:hypothetical protein
MTISEPPHRIPDGVIRRFRDGLIQDESDRMSPINQVLLDQAARMAWLRTPDGDVIEWWEAPNEAGGTCVYLRRLPAEGGDEGGSTECDSADGRPEGVLPMHIVVEETPRSGRWFLAGHVHTPGAATIRLGFADGRRHEVPVQPNGYLLELIPWTSDTQPWPSEAVVLDGHGEVIERDPGNPRVDDFLGDEERP